MAIGVILREQELRERGTKSIVDQNGDKSKGNTLRIVEDIPSYRLSKVLLPKHHELFF